MPETVPDVAVIAAVPAADVVTPNHFELDHLAGSATASVADVRVAVDGLRARGPETVLVTSLRTNETPADAVDLLASDASGCYRLRTPKLAISADGAGDVIAALFFFHLLARGSAAEALSAAASSVFGLLKCTAEAGAREMLLVAAQKEIVRPSRMFSAEKI